MATYHPIPLHFERLSSQEQLRRSQALLDHMKTRRTVRDFSNEPVPLTLITNAIATAGTAPSGANQQPWTFVVIQDKDVKRQIREAAEEEERISYTRRMSEAWLAALAPLGTNWHKPHLEKAPYLIVVFRQAFGIEVDSITGKNQKIKHYYSEESVGIAIGILLTSLHTAGLATLTHTPSPMKFLCDLLDRPNNERPVVVIPVGYPAENATVPDIKKKSLDEIMVVI